MKSPFKIPVRLLIISILASSSAFATGSVGLLAGSASLTNSGGSQTTYGLAYDQKIEGDWMLGAQFNTVNPASVSVGSASYSQTLTNADIAFKYAKDGLSAGVLVGAGQWTSNVPGFNSSTNGNYGVLVGYDYMISGFSVGAQVEYIATSSSNGYSSTDALVALKYWF